MPLPADFHDEGVNYRIRVCIKVMDDPLVGLRIGSKIHQCDRCDAPIWVDEKQVMPAMPEGIPLTGDVSMCAMCASISMDEVGPDQSTILDQ